MKLTRTVSWRGRFGTVEFVRIKESASIWRVAWLPFGADRFQYRDWYHRTVHPLDTPPNAKLARFFIRKFVAQDRGLQPHFYTDRNQDPD